MEKKIKSQYSPFKSVIFYVRRLLYQIFERTLGRLYILALCVYSVVCDGRIYLEV